MHEQSLTIGAWGFRLLDRRMRAAAAPCIAIGLGAPGTPVAARTARRAGLPG